MPTRFVNLDALIPREDFETDVDSQLIDQADRLKTNELESKNFFYLALRKPDFQRETRNWEPGKVAAFIQSFIEGDLIPAVILWQTKGTNVFVIDGAHRLSALIAWIHDDYGDGERSLKFFSNFIPLDQRKAAEETREMVNEQIGAYARLREAAVNLDTEVDPIIKTMTGPR